MFSELVERLRRGGADQGVSDGDEDPAAPAADLQALQASLQGTLRPPVKQLRRSLGVPWPLGVEWLANRPFLQRCFWIGRLLCLVIVGAGLCFIWDALVRLAGSLALTPFGVPRKHLAVPLSLAGCALLVIEAGRICEWAWRWNSMLEDAWVGWGSWRALVKHVVLSECPIVLLEALVAWAHVVTGDRPAAVSFGRGLVFQFMLGYAYIVVRIGSAWLMKKEYDAGAERWCTWRVVPCFGGRPQDDEQRPHLLKADLWAIVNVLVYCCLHFVLHIFVEVPDVIVAFAFTSNMALLFFLRGRYWMYGVPAKELFSTVAQTRASILSLKQQEFQACQEVWEREQEVKFDRLAAVHTTCMQLIAGSAKTARLISQEETARKNAEAEEAALARTQDAHRESAKAAAAADAAYADFVRREEERNQRADIELQRLRADVQNASEDAARSIGEAEREAGAAVEAAKADARRRIDAIREDEPHRRSLAEAAHADWMNSAEEEKARLLDEIDRIQREAENLAALEETRESIDREFLASRMQAQHVARFLRADRPDAIPPGLACRLWRVCFHGQIVPSCAAKALPPVKGRHVCTPGDLVHVEKAYTFEAPNSLKNALNLVKRTPEEFVLQNDDAYEVLHSIEVALKNPTTSPQECILEPPDFSVKGISLSVRFEVLRRQWSWPVLGDPSKSVHTVATFCVIPKDDDDYRVADDELGFVGIDDDDDGEEKEDDDEEDDSGASSSSWELQTNVPDCVLRVPTDRYLKLADGTLLIQSRKFPFGILMRDPEPKSAHFRLLNPSEIPKLCFAISNTRN